MNVQPTNITTTVRPGKYNYGISCACPFVTRFKIKTINLLYWLSIIPINIDKLECADDNITKDKKHFNYFTHQFQKRQSELTWILKRLSTNKKLSEANVN